MKKTTTVCDSCGLECTSVAGESLQDWLRLNGTRAVEFKVSAPVDQEASVEAALQQLGDTPETRERMKRVLAAQQAYMAAQFPETPQLPRTEMQFCDIDVCPACQLAGKVGATVRMALEDPGSSSTGHLASLAGYPGGGL